MDNLIIEPGEGIGLIKFGMSKDEVEKCIQSYTEKYQKEYHIQDYFKGFFMLEYDSEGKVDFIEIPEVLKETFNCLLMGIDVFNTKAEDLVEKIDEIAEYDRNQSDGYTYFFPSLGLSLWRSDIFKEEC
ncbi:hypothetical protein P4U99_25925 [Brevibacillus agri]|uniref:hypothetical protein n=2 Tax=Brevibacillus agri TaxID=51101 RepID=UPI001C8D6603|nr:hypothetical protein [Brevibacillus agri]MBY0054662.1 hypothetical protein [Brevibacillus agri]MED1646560.1 hypothetical protein [Brevibacillus agri]MED1657810.1 hypothetical protein [Brevibacillus agri]MED1690226.1 hypothetical protein [Brevibacillus agri]MED1695335.1 hypothetical protein [Brevibacillus agri]